MKRKLLIVFGGLLTLYIFSVLAFYFMQEQIIFRSSELDRDFKFKVNHKSEEFFVQTSNNGEIHGICLKNDSPEGVILYFHGNKGNLNRWIGMVEPLMQFKYDIIIVDYRRYGKSGGVRQSEFLYQDALDVFDSIKVQSKFENIILYGRSLGSTFATYVASNRETKLLILETPFYSMSSIVKHFYPLLPTEIIKYELPTHSFIKAVEEPIIFLQGNADVIVPYENAGQLFLKADNAKWVKFEGGGHNDLSTYPLYWATMDSLLNL